MHNTNHSQIPDLKLEIVTSLISQHSSFSDNKLALVSELGNLSYTQLNNYSNVLANNLMQRGIKKGEMVGILLPLGQDLIISILAVLKTGAAYIPLSKSYPISRINKIKSISGLSLTICEKEQSYWLNTHNFNTLSCEDLNFDIPSSEISVEICPNDLAYVLFTSGSTGNPKGVRVLHKNLSFYTNWTKTFFKNCVNNHLPLTSEINFAASVSQIYSCLSAGATLHILPGILNDPEKLFNWYSLNPEYGLYCVPSVWHTCIEGRLRHKNVETAGPRTLFFSGENLSPRIIEYTNELFPDTEIWNLYGPTEAVANLSFKKIVSHQKISIGSPLPETEFFVINENNSVAQIGDMGILHASGPGICDGYLSDPCLSKDSFFSFQTPHGLKVVYNTGDIVKQIDENEFVFIGRQDEQVKIRGQRIELLEIEKTILSIEGILRCKTILSKNESPHLIAYLQLSLSSKLSVSKIQSYCRENLPPAMIPEKWIVLNQFPVLENGKINTALLPEPDKFRPNLDNSYTAPKNEEEGKIVEIFEKVLCVEHIGINDDFFELGGNSLKAVSLIIEIEEVFLRNINFQIVFSNPTPKALLNQILLTQDKQVEQIEKPKEFAKASLSDKQKALLFFQMHDMENASYNIAYAITFSDVENFEHLHFVLKRFFSSIKSLNYRLTEENGESLLTYISENLDIAIEPVKLKDYDKSNIFIEQSISDEASKPFDLFNSRLFKLKLYQVNEKTYTIGFIVNHLIFDGGSLPVLLQNFLGEYNSCEFTSSDLKVEKLTAPKIINVNQDNLANSSKFWQGYLANITEMNTLPNIYNFEKTIKSQGSRFDSIIDIELRKSAEFFCRENKFTMNMLFLACFAVVLHKLSTHEEWLIASPFANRTTKQLKSAIGYFSNTVFYKILFEQNKTFLQLLTEIKNDTINILQNQASSLQDLISILRKNGVKVPASGFKLLFGYHDCVDYSISDNDIKIVAKELFNNHSKCDLHIEFFDNSETVDIKFTYDNGIMYEEMAIQFIQIFKNVLTDALLKINSPITDLGQPDKFEKSTILSNSVGTKVNHKTKQCLFSHFEEICKKHPDLVAIQFNNQHIKYNEVYNRISIFIRHLETFNLNSVSAIAIYLDHSPDLIIACLSCAALGIPYIPLDPTYPESRNAYILNHANVKIIISSSDLSSNLDENKQQILYADKIDYTLPSDLKIVSKVDPDNLLYIIYTSGSSGNPKGVMISNIGAVNYLLWMKDKFGIDEREKIIAKTSISFDISIWELFLPLICGGTTVLTKRSKVESPEQIANLIKENSVTIAQFVPSGLEIFNNENLYSNLPSLKTIFCGGEKLPLKLKNEVVSKFKGSLHNLYGPTEASIFMCHYSCNEASNHVNVPIGKPINNSSFFVLDNNKRLVSRLVPGNLFIGGSVLAKGYLNDEEQNKKNFLLNVEGFDGNILYDTGDTGRLLLDGNFEFIGRTDNQIKIRGYRVELGEIDAQILAYPDVKAAVAIKIKLAENDERLYAFIVKNGECNSDEIKKHLKLRLPYYMIPSQIIFVDSIPLLPNGKTDTKNLINRGKEYTEQPNKQSEVSSDDLEKLFRKIWIEVIGHANFSNTDNFFDAGGHSILFIKIKEIIEKKLKTDLSLVELYQYPNIKSLAELYRSKNFDQVSETITSIRNRIELKKKKTKIWKTSIIIKERLPLLEWIADCQERITCRNIGTI